MKKQFSAFLFIAVFSFLLGGCTFSVNKDKTTPSASTPSPAPSTAAKEGAKASESPSPSATPKASETPKDVAKNEFETRCGWFANPTPANAWLTDKDGEWTVSVQGGYQADGDWPEFGDGQWIETNGSYGYGCACMDVTVDKSKMRFVKIKSAKPRPLSACRNDKALSEPED